MAAGRGSGPRADRDELAVPPVEPANEARRERLCEHQPDVHHPNPAHPCVDGVIVGEADRDELADIERLVTQAGSAAARQVADPDRAGPPLRRQQVQAMALERKPRMFAGVLARPRRALGCLRWGRSISWIVLAA